MSGAGLTPAPEPLTELSFLHPSDLPRQLDASEASLRVPFVIRNAGEDAREYAWTMTVGGEGAGRRVASGVARVASGAGTAVRRTVPVACTGSRVRVEVSVAEPARAISFQAACSSSPATEVGG